jgi:hypothetical protein
MLFTLQKLQQSTYQKITKTIFKQRGDISSRFFNFALVKCSKTRVFFSIVPVGQLTAHREAETGKYHPLLRFLYFHKS